MRSQSEIGEKSFTWSTVGAVFPGKELWLGIERMERAYSVVDESEIFSALVNMSSANKLPFHRWVRYREGYAGELVKEILRRYPISSETHFILDPMCGSGSSLVAASEKNIDAMGLDVNGYAILATNVKCARYDMRDIERLQEWLDQLLCLDANDCITDVEDGISKYFPLENYKILRHFREWISSLNAPRKDKDFLLLGLLACLEDCSNRKKDGNGLATRPSPVRDVKKRFHAQLVMMLEDIIIAAGRRNESNCFAYDCSATELKKTVDMFSNKIKKKLGAIIFSPPYANSFDYFESYKLELLFGGFSTAEKIGCARNRLIRSYRISKPKPQEHRFHLVEQLCAEVISQVPKKEYETGVRDARTRLVPNMLRGYFEDMRNVFQLCYDALDKNGEMHVVVDQSAYVGVPIPTDLILASICEGLGFTVVGIINCRRANTSGQQLNKYPYLKSLLRESIVSLRK